MSLYRLIFPLHEDDPNGNGEDVVYAFGIVPHSIGVITPQTWHRPLDKLFPSMLEALTFATVMRETLSRGDPCTCGEPCKYLAQIEPEQRRLFLER